MNTFRIGFGYDVHVLEAGDGIWLGGIKIPHDKKCVGHSDADVLIHAICDALLGAANLGDIGLHFPNTDMRYKNIDSKKLLAEVVQIIGEKGYKVGNIDSMLIAEAPKINPHIGAMKTALAKAMGADTEQISIKATTNEGMGFVGREEGIAAHAVALIVKS